MQQALRYSGVQLDAIQYPAWANHPWASWRVTAARAAAMACSQAASVRAAWARMRGLTLAPLAAIGAKAGAEGGRASSRPPAVAQRSATPDPGWALRCAMRRTWPGRRWGPSPARQKARQTSPSVPPAPGIAAPSPWRLQAPRRVSWRPRWTGWVARARAPRGPRASRRLLA